jgi:hypothetical protein
VDGHLYPPENKHQNSSRFEKRAAATGNSMKKRYPKTEEELAERFDAGEDLEITRI